MADTDAPGGKSRRGGRAEYLEGLVKSAKIGGVRGPSLELLAKELGVTRTTIYNWVRYDRPIDPANISRLAAVLSDNPDDAKAIEARLHWFRDLAARKAEARQDFDPTKSVFDRIKTDPRIRVAFVSYEPVSAPEENTTFLRRLMQLFTDAVGIECVLCTPGGDLTDLSGEIRAGRLDLACGLMVTPDRQRSVHFIPTPVRLPLAALVLDRDLVDQFGIGSLWRRQGLLKKASEKPEDYVAEFVELLLDPIHLASSANGIRLSGLMRPVVREGEVGHAYAKHFLGFNGSEPSRRPVQISTYDPEHYAQALVEADRRNGMPVMIADLLACVRTFEHLRGMGDHARLLFPRGPQTPKVAGRKAMSPPAYYVGIACDREDDRFITYLNFAFETFLESYPAQISTLYVELFDELSKKTAGLADEAEILKWIGLGSMGDTTTTSDGGDHFDRTFQRDTSTNTLRPWRPILWRAAATLRSRDPGSIDKRKA